MGKIIRFVIRVADYFKKELSDEEFIFIKRGLLKTAESYKFYAKYLKSEVKGEKDTNRHI